MTYQDPSRPPQTTNKNERFQGACPLAGFQGAAPLGRGPGRGPGTGQVQAIALTTFRRRRYARLTGACRRASSTAR